MTRMDGAGGAVIVGHGSRVCVREAGGEARTLQIRDDGAPTYDSIQPGSPLGRALMGRRVGDEVEVGLADCLPTRRLTIEAIE